MGFIWICQISSPPSSPTIPAWSCNFNRLFGNLAVSPDIWDEPSNWYYSIYPNGTSLVVDIIKSLAFEFFLNLLGGRSTIFSVFLATDFKNSKSLINFRQIGVDFQKNWWFRLNLSPQTNFWKIRKIQGFDSKLIL